MNEEQLPEAPAVNGAAAATMSPSIQNLAVALVAAQTDLPKLAKDKENPFFHSKYAGLDTVLPAALKVLSAHGIALLQSVGQDGHGGSTLTTMLMHQSGEWVRDTQPLLLVKNDPQGQGSAITYARRYAVMSMLGLVAEEDDDGNAASRPRAAPRPQPPVRERTAASQPQSASPAAPPPRPPIRTASVATPPDAPLDNRPSTVAQHKTIHINVDKIWGEDKRTAYEWVKERCPRAAEASPTQLHFGELSMGEASALIKALFTERDRRQPAGGPQEATG